MAVGIVLFVAPLGAEDEAPQLERQVAQWIADLRSDDFAVRDAARKRLKAVAHQARKWLAPALDDPDPEVRRTVRALLGPARIPTPTPVQIGDFSRLLSVGFDYEDKTAADALADFGRRFGGSFDVPESHAKKRVTVKAENVPYFEGLRTLLVAAELHMAAAFDRAGVAQLVAARPGVADAVPAVAAGPLWVRVIGRQTTVRFGHPPPAPHYALNLDVWWPPGIQVNQIRSLRVEVARDEKGRPFTSPGRGMTYGLGQGMFSRTLDVALHPKEAEHGDKLAVLEITVPMRLRHGREVRSTTRTDALPVVLGSKGEPVEKLVADGSVAFRSLATQEGRTRTWIAEVAARLSEDVSRQSAQVSLETASGRHVAMYLATGRSESADGTLHLTARAYNAGEERPKRIALQWFRHEEDGSVRIRFEDIALK